MLSLLGALSEISGGNWLGAIPSLILGMTGLWTLVQQDNAKARKVNFWSSAIIYGVGMLAFLLLLIGGTIGSSDISTQRLLGFWMFFGISLLFVYWVLSIAWFWMEGSKVDNDNDFSRA